MISVKRFHFNPYQVNTYILHDESGECIIIDPGMDSNDEKQEFDNYIESNNLKPVKLYNTHAHIDHIISNGYVCEKYGIPLSAHPDSTTFYDNAMVYASTFGFKMEDVKPIDDFLDDNQVVEFGKSKLKVFETPGHADGSVCFYSEEDKFVITGDVLFRESIGRTDLKTGDYDLLQKSIWEKLFTLPDNTTAYPGHGPSTNIGFEKIHNPFVAIGKDLD
ncbi:MAG: MBL fold hydrolase [Marinilabiliales bacterium]|nr:MAG: MBL fold hydrolase [Marinilabiliales bacterium]